MKKKSRVFVVSGPSGAGKGTLIRGLLKRVEDIALSTSVTTRLPRNGEKNGAHYFFVSEAAFREKIRGKKFLEWARVHDDYYGTPVDFVRKQLSAGKDVVLELDVQGALTVKRRAKDACLIFIMPSSFKELEKRLVLRGTESREEIAQRLKTARSELCFLSFYDYLIYNDDVKTAVENIVSVVRAERLRIRQLGTGKECGRKK